MTAKPLVWDWSIHVHPSLSITVVTESGTFSHNERSGIFKLTTLLIILRPSTRTPALEYLAPHLMTPLPFCQWRQISLKTRKTQLTTTRQEKQLLQKTYQVACRNVCQWIKNLFPFIFFKPQLTQHTFPHCFLVVASPKGLGSASTTTPNLRKYT